MFLSLILWSTGESLLTSLSAFCLISIGLCVEQASCYIPVDFKRLGIGNILNSFLVTFKEILIDFHKSAKFLGIKSA